MRAQNTQVLPLQIPYRGMSTRYSLAKMPPEFCQLMENMEVESGVLETPKGANHEFAANTTSVGCIARHPILPWKLFQIDTSQNPITGNTFEPVLDAIGTPISGPHGATNQKATALGYKDLLYFFLQGGAPLVYNGTTLAAVGFTGPSLSSVVGGTSYREHLYVFEEDSSSVWYAPSPGTISGAFLEYPLNLVTRETAKILCLFPFTLASGLDSQTLLCFVMDSGEVLVYSGTRPNTSDWIQRGHTKVAAPLGIQSTIEVNGDQFLMTKQGIVSIRELFTNAQGVAQRASVTGEIEKFWTKTIETIDALDFAASYSLPSAKALNKITGAYHQIKNKLVIFIPRIVRPATTGSGQFGFVDSAGIMALIYDFANSAWTMRTFADIASDTSNDFVLTAYYHDTSNRFFFGGSSMDAFSLWGASEYVDIYNSGGSESNITATIRSAPIAIAGNKSVKGIQITHAGTTSSKSQMSLKLIAELGQRETATVTHGGLITGISKDLYNAGVIADLVQIQTNILMDTDATAAYQIGNISALLEPGGVIG